MGKILLVDCLAISDVYMPIVEARSLLLHCTQCGRVVLVTTRAIKLIMGIAIGRQASIGDLIGEYVSCCDTPDLRGQVVTLISGDNTPQQDDTNGNGG